MDMGAKKPWIGVQNTMGRWFDTPYVEVSNYHPICHEYGVQYTLDRWFDIPWERGSKYHGYGSDIPWIAGSI